MNVSHDDLPALRTYVTDGAYLSCNNSLSFGASGCTNGSLYVRNGGKVKCNGFIYLGNADENPQYQVAPYGCVLEVDGEGSVVTNNGMTVGACRLSGDKATGCCT